MVQRTKVLIFPAGSEIGIEIFHALKYNIHVEVFGASGKADHARYLYDTEHYFEGDYYVDNDNFLNLFNNLLETKQIDFIFPTHDTIALFLASNQSSLSAIVITSDAETAIIARDKRKTYEVFSGFDFCPKIFNPPFKRVSFPVFIKPIMGQGGKGASRLDNINDLQRIPNIETDYVVCEYLPGEELGVDCFTARNGTLLFMGPRTRERVQMGISFHTEMVSQTNEIQNIANTINNKLKLRGTWFFQIKKDVFGKFKLLEFAVRHASTMGLYRQAGVNFPLLSLFDRMGKDILVLANQYQISLDRCLYNRFKMDLSYYRVYIDFDDTIIIQGKVNLTAIKYLYHCRNRGIEIILLTKHLFSLDDTLSQYALNKHLFNEIIHIGMEEEKADFIAPEGSIFIDNYFSDRQKVSNRLGIPVFDVDAIESLILD